MAKTNITHREIVEMIRRGEYKPIFLLMGEEAYYIDRLSEYIADNVLTKDELSSIVRVKRMSLT